MLQKRKSSFLNEWVVIQACGRAVWSKKDTGAYKKKYEGIMLWVCGRVVWSKYERPSIFLFKMQIVLCCGLVAVWDIPKMIQVH
jgi:hypothetical protein